MLPVIGGSQSQYPSYHEPTLLKVNTNQFSSVGIYHKPVSCVQTLNLAVTDWWDCAGSIDL